MVPAFGPRQRRRLHQPRGESLPEAFPRCRRSPCATTHRGEPLSAIPETGQPRAGLLRVPPPPQGLFARRTAARTAPATSLNVGRPTPPSRGHLRSFPLLRDPMVRVPCLRTPSPSPSRRPSSPGAPFRRSSGRLPARCSHACDMFDQMPTRTPVRSHIFAPSPLAFYQIERHP
jgi:hypothetical protein